MPTFVERFALNRASAAGTVFLAIVIILAVIGPLLVPTDPFKIVGTPFLPPFSSFLFGTDILGRDVGTGILYGARTSLVIGSTATIFAIVVGIAVGGIAGYYRGIVDDLLMRLTEFFQTIPSFLLVIIVVAVLSPSIYTIVLAVAVGSWSPVARLVRAEVLSLREREFVLAARSMGASDLKIMTRHVLPNCLAPIIVMASLMVANAILIESALSFLGLGDPNLMSWGYMIGEGRTFLRSDWWLCAEPGLAILLTVLSINLVGEGLNNALNPRLMDQ